MTSSAFDQLMKKIPVVAWLQKDKVVTGARLPDGFTYSAEPLVLKSAVSNTATGYLLKGAMATAQTLYEAVEQASKGELTAEQAQAVISQVGPLLDSVENVAQAQAAKEKAVKSMLGTNEWWESRWATMWTWAHKELTEQQKTEFFNIAANGSASPEQSPSRVMAYAEIADAQKRIKQLETELAVAKQLLNTSSA